MTTKTAYPKYKKTPVAWFPSIPSDWEINRGKFYFRHYKEINKTMDCDNVLSLTMNGVLHREELGEGGLLPTSYETFQIFNKGDLVFKLIDLENFKTSRVGIVPEKGIMSSAYIRLAKNNKNINPKYFYWLYYNLYLQGIYNFLGMGVRSTLNSWDLLELPIIIPNEKMQKRIADFLDEKTRVIDELISKKEKLIKIQKEKINFSALGIVDSSNKENYFWKNIKADWKIMKARWVFEEIIIRNKINENLLAVTQDRGVIPKEMCEENFVSPVNYDSLKLVEKNDFVISLRSFEGGIEFSDYKGIVSPAYTVLRLNEKYNNTYYSKYFKYLLKTPQFITLLNTIIMGIRDGKNVNYSDFRNLPLLVPTEESIKEMLKEIDKHERFVFCFNKEKKLLNEYRASLIYSAVTGKIKI